MRHPLVPALVVLVLLAAYAVAGAVLAGAAPAASVTVEGSVTGVGGGPPADGVVLVGDYGMLAKLSPDELRDVADDDPQNLAVVAVDDDGRFSATVPAERAGAAVALSPAGISEVVRLGGADATLDLALHERRPQTVRTAAEPAAPGERTRLYVDLHHNGDHAVENLSVSLVGVPDGWQVLEPTGNGTYDAETRTFTWASLPAGSSVDVSLELAVPDDAALREHRLELRATSESHPVSVENATVAVREETTGPTKTVVGGEGATSTARITKTTSLTPSPTGTTAPGFGLLVTMVALAAAVPLVRRE